jgi:Flp pilus assembly pilin Flp
MGTAEWIWLSLVPRGSRVDRCVSHVIGRVSGQSTVEYALVGALVVIASAGAMALLGDQIGSVFGRITSTLSTSGAATGH